MLKLHVIKFQDINITFFFLPSHILSFFLDRLNIATEVIAENLSKNWRKLGRKLGLSEVKLESISKRHPTDIEETVVEMLKEWRIHRGAEARTIDLLEALRACQYNLTADKVEEKLAQADVDGQ